MVPLAMVDKETMNAAYKAANAHIKAEIERMGRDHGLYIGLKPRDSFDRAREEISQSIHELKDQITEMQRYNRNALIITICLYWGLMPLAICIGFLIAAHW